MSRRRHGGGTIVNARFAVPEGPALGRPVSGVRALAAVVFGGLALAVLLVLGGG